MKRTQVNHSGHENKNIVKGLVLGSDTHMQVKTEAKTEIANQHRIEGVK